MNLRKNLSYIRIYFVTLILFFLNVSIINCASAPAYKDVNASVKYLLNDAERLIQEKKYGEASESLRAVFRIYPEDAKAELLWDKLPEIWQRRTKYDNALGPGLSRRSPEESGFFERLAWYIPDRLLDLFDIYSVNVMVGPQIGASVWYTRAIQTTLYAGKTVSFGWSQKRNLGISEESSAEYAFFGFGGAAIHGRRIGTGRRAYAGTWDGFFVHMPSNPLYVNYRDYWSAGSKVGLVLIGAEVEVHYTELADFLAGFFLVDFMEDDFATTNSIRFNREQEDHLYRVINAADRYNERQMNEFRNAFPESEKIQETENQDFQIIVPKGKNKKPN
ncbi:hypothetical protein EHQ52_13705 [Leptospira koniambonensis]|uniref:Uncharacterized protein n=1 Tax=Leptospira koniambonensis TaxID=2484950 RepID=A0A4R9J3N6_9LEPT|nr:hypothetical protein [Leptospira koniambonensis]TGL32352.1 hypothetical protein EHQ52_13705 [Leptospira koniambonensis]